MRVLVVIGTSHFDLHDLCEALAEHGIDCTVRHWNAIADPPGHYDLAVLFGLTGYWGNTDLYAGTVRRAIGSGTKLLIVSTWNPRLIAGRMKDAYGAEYVHRHGPFKFLLEKVLQMLSQTKTAP